MMRKFLRSGLLIAFLASILGCAEGVAIRTTPPAAKLYVNGAYVSTAHYTYIVPRSNMDQPYTFRLERTGYHPYEATLQTRTSGGRIAGTALTLGILLLFRGWTVFRDPVDVDPQRISTGAAEIPPPGAPVQ